MATVTIPELSQSRNVLNSIAKQKALVTLSFPSFFLFHRWNKLDAKIRNLPSVS